MVVPTADHSGEYQAISSEVSGPDLCGLFHRTLPRLFPAVGRLQFLPDCPAELAFCRWYFEYRLDDDPAIDVSVAITGANLPAGERCAWRQTAADGFALTDGCGRPAIDTLWLEFDVDRPAGPPVVFLHVQRAWSPAAAADEAFLDRVWHRWHGGQLPAAVRTDLAHWRRALPPEAEVRIAGTLVSRGIAAVRIGIQRLERAALVRLAGHAGDTGLTAILDAAGEVLFRETGELMLTVDCGIPGGSRCGLEFFRPRNGWAVVADHLGTRGLAQPHKAAALMAPPTATAVFIPGGEGEPAVHVPGVLHTLCHHLKLAYANGHTLRAKVYRCARLVAAALPHG